MLRLICMAPEGAPGGAGGAGGGEAAAADPLKNIKAEFDRKLDGQTAMIGQLQETTKALLAQLTVKVGSDRKNLPEPAKKSFGQRIYDEPDAAAEDLVNEAVDRVQKNLNRQGEVVAKEQRIVAELRSDYPELYDIQSDLAQKAIEQFSKLPEDEKIPAMYRLCVKEAADELGIVPKKKRKAGTDDDINLGGSGGGRGRGTGGASTQLDEKTLTFAKFCGLDTNDEKVVERLKSRQRNEREWLQYR